MNANDFVISTQGLSKSFGEVHALQSLDLRVPEKSIFAFLGPNGSDKTTTIKLLLGLIKPTSGSGKIFGMDIVRDSVDIRGASPSRTNSAPLPGNVMPGRCLTGFPLRKPRTF